MEARLIPVSIVACAYSISAESMRHRLEEMSRYFGVLFRGVIVSNRGQTSYEVDGDLRIVAGTNRCFDFSAYLEGLSSLDDCWRVPESVVFINDSFFLTHHSYENFSLLLKQLPLLARLKAPAIAGRVDRYHTVCHVNPWSGLGIYVSTYCFALNSLALPVLRAINTTAETELTDSGVSNILDEQWGQGLQAPFREFIRMFLAYENPAFSWKGLRRHGSSETLILVKARCIYLEHRLSGEIGRIGSILPINLGIRGHWKLNFSEHWALFRRKVFALFVR